MFVRELKRKTTRNIASSSSSPTATKTDSRDKEPSATWVPSPKDPPSTNSSASPNSNYSASAPQKFPALFPPRDPRRTGPRRPPADARPTVPCRSPTPANSPEEKRLVLGFHEVFGKLYSDLGLDRLWTSRQKVSERAFRQAILMRLAHPRRSKRAHSGIAEPEVRSRSPARADLPHDGSAGRPPDREVEGEHRTPGPGTPRREGGRDVPRRHYAGVRVRVRGRPAAKGIQQGRQAAPGSGGSGAASERRRPSAGVSGVPGKYVGRQDVCSRWWSSFRREYRPGSGGGRGGRRDGGAARTWRL